jgi:hypothetical protein
MTTRSNGSAPLLLAALLVLTAALPEASAQETPIPAGRYA